MDVRCERCKTEYEFDDARITEAGVTVKCTTCSHVFKVKKKALVVTVPVKPDEVGAQAPLPTQEAAAPAAEKPREWKVRQANGNLFTFKELTTLQKWIVERKVSRDDEISLTGESWKRLGNIAELASFFQVVEEALKAQQLQAMQQQAMLGPILTPSGGNPLPTVQNSTPPPPSVTHPGTLPVVGAPPAAPPSPAPAPEPAPAARPSPSARAVMNAARAPEPRFLAHEDGDDIDDLAAAGIKKGGGAGKWVVALLVLAALGAGGFFAWQQGHLDPLLAKLQPPPQTTEATPPAEVQPPTLVAVSPEAPDASAQVAEVMDAGTPADAAAALAPQDAGAVAAVAEAPAEAAQPTAVTEEKRPREPVRDFDYWMTQGDRLRERERSEAAMDAYGKAVDLSPTRAEPYAGRGYALLDLGRPDAAEASFQQALRHNSRYAVAVMGLAETYRQMGRKQEAISQYERYLEILPNGPEARLAKSAIERLKE